MLFMGCAPTVLPPLETKPAENVKPAIDYSLLGVPVNLNEELDIKGVQVLWIEGTKILITTRGTKWDEFTENGKVTRDGRAIIEFKDGHKERTVTIGEGTEKLVFGYRVSVSLAWEFYNKLEATYVPHIKMTISR
jgi:hypothetical protein